MNFSHWNSLSRGKCGQGRNGPTTFNHLKIRFGGYFAFREHNCFSLCWHDLFNHYGWDDDDDDDDDDDEKENKTLRPRICNLNIKILSHYIIS